MNRAATIKQYNRQIAWLFTSLTIHEKVNKLAIMIMHWLLDNVWHHLDWRKKEHAPLSAFGNAYLPRYKKWGLIIAKFASEISFWNLSIPVLLTGISNQFRNYETWVFFTKFDVYFDVVKVTFNRELVSAVLEGYLLLGISVNKFSVRYMVQKGS